MMEKNTGVLDMKPFISFLSISNNDGYYLSLLSYVMDSLQKK